jgi:hypothetical protein
LVGERSERDISPGDRQHGDGEPAVHAADLGRRVHGDRKREQDRHSDRRTDCCNEQRIGNDARLRPVSIGQQLREPTSQAKSGELGSEFDGEHRISEAAQLGRSVNPAGDEQEWEPRREPEHESEYVQPPPAREGRHVRIRCVRRSHADAAIG